MPIIQGKLVDLRHPLIEITISNDLGLAPIDDIGPQQLYPQTKKVRALIDTGATISALDQTICHEMGLETQSRVPMLSADQAHDEWRTVYSATVFLHSAHGSDEKHEWPDVALMVGMNISNRPFNAVIGMDIIGKSKLRIENGVSILLEF